MICVFQRTKGESEIEKEGWPEDSWEQSGILMSVVYPWFIKINKLKPQFFFY